MREGRFRADLWYRLCVFAIELPPLRARPGDVAYLLRRELPALVERLRVPPRAIKPEFVDVFAQNAWPGNVRELLHALERALLLAEGDALDAAVARAAIAMGSLDAPDPSERSPSAKPAQPADGRERIAAILRETGGNVSRAARRLRVARSTLRWQVQRYGLQELIPED